MKTPPTRLKDHVEIDFALGLNGRLWPTPLVGASNCMYGRTPYTNGVARKLEHLI